MKKGEPTSKALTHRSIVNSTARERQGINGVKADAAKLNVGRSNWSLGDSVPFA
jgi:hypothetical protein